MDFYHSTNVDREKTDVIYGCSLAYNQLTISLYCHSNEKCYNFSSFSNFLTLDSLNVANLFRLRQIFIAHTVFNRFFLMEFATIELHLISKLYLILSQIWPAKNKNHNFVVYNKLPSNAYEPVIPPKKNLNDFK